MTRNRRFPSLKDLVEALAPDLFFTAWPRWGYRHQNRRGKSRGGWGYMDVSSRKLSFRGNYDCVDRVGGGESREQMSEVSKAGA